jgi:Transposase DDE domain group 1
LLITHPVGSFLRTRFLAIACGYEDADDLDHLRKDPAFRLACGRLPDTGEDLCSQPTMSRWENAPALREILKLSGILIDFYCASYATPPQAVTLDIDDTCDVAHGHQQLSLFNAHYDDRCFLPIHVYDAATGPPCRGHSAARQDTVRQGSARPSAPDHPPHPRALAHNQVHVRRDSHYGRREVRDWCEDNGDYVFGLPGNKLLAAAVEVQADDIRTRRALEQMPILRSYAQTDYAANSWKGERRVCARVEATELGLDTRFVVTNITNGSAEHFYDTLYCRACANGKSDQIAQDPAGVGRNFLSCAARQSVAAHLARCRILVDARSA